MEREPIQISPADCLKIRKYVRAKADPAFSDDGCAWLEHAVNQKTKMFEWSLAVRPELTVDEYLTLKQEPWLEETLKKKGKRSKRHCHS